MVDVENGQLLAGRPINRARSLTDHRQEHERNLSKQYTRHSESTENAAAVIHHGDDKTFSTQVKTSAPTPGKRVINSASSKRDGV